MFITRPISAGFIGACALLIIAQLVAYARKVLRASEQRRGTAELAAE